MQLKNRGLIISDESFASDFLEHVSYFRFAAYLRPMEIDKAHNYKTGASFDNAVKLYRFDSELRQLVFSAIQRIEVSLRAKIINKFSLRHGAMWFLRPELANDKHNFTDNLSTLERELKRSKEDFIKDHINKYGQEEYPPVWKLLELASFGCLTKLYFNFADTKTKKGHSKTILRAAARNIGKLDESPECIKECLRSSRTCMEQDNASNASDSRKTHQ